MINILRATQYIVTLYDAQQLLSMYYEMMIKYQYEFCLNLRFILTVNLSIPLITI